MITLKDLARQLGLSISTVSRALGENPEIRPATVKRVRALAAELGYQPNALGVSLRKGRSGTLGVLVPHLQNNFFPRLVQGVEQAASAAGYSLLICQSGEDTGRERRHLETLLRAQVEGIIVSVARTTTDFTPFAQLQQQQMPLVFFDRFLEGQAVSAVVIDDRAGGYQATRHLLAQGYRRIAHLAGPPHLSIYRHRRQGYEDALREAGLPVEPALLVQSDLRLPDGEQAIRQLLALATPPNAVFAASDFAALGCLTALQAAGRQVPGEFGVMGFGDEFFSQHTAPTLSSVDQRAEALGQAAVQLLLELKQPATISSRRRRAAPAAEEAVAEATAAPSRHLVLSPRLLVRASSTRLMPAV